MEGTIKADENEANIIELARMCGATGAADLAALGMTRERMTRRGLIQRIARGRYRLPVTDITEHHDLALFAAQVRLGVVTLISALAFHNMGTHVVCSEGPRPHT
ncbi:hypothetical protein [Teredinibacter haidensis]|uniref:hypothetical protein n=1 Tax=Teredinibacter haidensis TaxID=2731755 RepID=UPI0009F8AD0C|nr:hypothetical protein [Teredinibacter haidensis]